MTREDRLADMRREAAKIWEDILYRWADTDNDRGAWADSAQDLDDVKDALEDEDKDIFSYAVDEEEAERIVEGTLDEDVYEIGGFSVSLRDYEGKEDPCYRFLRGYMKSLVCGQIDSWYEKNKTDYVYEIFDPSSPKFGFDFAGRERFFRTELYEGDKLKAAANTKSLRKAVEGAQALEKAYPDRYVAIVYKDSLNGTPCDMIPEEIPAVLWRYADPKIKYPSDGEDRGK